MPCGGASLLFLLSMDFNTLVTNEATSTKGAGLIVTIDHSFDGTSAAVTVFDDTGSYICDAHIADCELDSLKSDMPRAMFD